MCMCRYCVCMKCSMGCAGTGTHAFVHGGLSNFVLDDLYAVDLSNGAWSEVGPWVPCMRSHDTP